MELVDLRLPSQTVKSQAVLDVIYSIYLIPAHIHKNLIGVMVFIQLYLYI